VVACVVGPPVKIVVDSTVGLPPEVLAENDISVVPIPIQIGDTSYEEDVDITREQFYQALLEGKQPLTSQPPPGSFFRVYQPLVAAGRTIISIQITGRHSGTVQSARLATQMFPGADITVVDSEFISGAMGLLALVAAQAAKAGRSKEEILKAIEDAKPRTTLLVCVPTLAYLRRSGRVSSVTAAIGDAFSIRVILTMQNGFLQVATKVRSFRRALERAVTMAEEHAGKAKVQVVILHANAPAAAEELRKVVEDRLDVVRSYVSDLGSALATHGGPGMVGLACLRL